MEAPQVTKNTSDSTAVTSLSYHIRQEVGTEKCTQWLETMSVLSYGETDSFTGTGTDDPDDGSSLMTDCTESIGGDSSTWLVPNRVKESNQIVWNDKTMLRNGDNALVNSELNTIFNQNKNIYTNVKINKSKQIHLGNVTYINGPVFIGPSQEASVENERTLEANFEVTKRFRMVNRTNWLAQPPMEEKIIFKKSAKYVIVCKYKGQDKKCRFLCIYERLESMFKTKETPMNELLLERRLKQNN